MKRSVWACITSACACALTALIGPVAAGAAPLDSRSDRGVSVANGPVNAIAVAADGTTYISGAFSYVGPWAPLGAALDPVSGAVQTSFARVSEEFVANQGQHHAR